MSATDVEDRPTLALVDKKTVGGEALRYFAASLAALMLDASLLWIGVRAFALPAWIAGAFAYGAGLVLIYGLSIHWVFDQRTMRDGRGEFMLFAVLGLIGLVLNSATLFVATGLGLALPIAKIVSAGIGFVANFVSRKLLLFSAHSSTRRSVDPS